MARGISEIVYGNKTPNIFEKIKYFNDLQRLCIEQANELFNLRKEKREYGRKTNRSRYNTRNKKTSRS